MAFDGIVIANLVKDLNDKIVSGRISKIAQPEKDEKNDHRQKGGEDINRIAEHVRRNFSDHQIPDHTSAHGGNDTENDDAEQIQLFADCYHGSGGGEGDSSDDFHEKDEV